jgi:hypothetical protein
MTTDKAQKFRALVNVLVSQGFNLWDARMEARKLLGIRTPTDRLNYARSRIRSEWAVTDRHHYSLIPTIEDRVELYFRSIVATCKSVVYGTAVFRSFSEFGQTWQDEVKAPRNRGRYSKDSKEFKGITKSSYYVPTESKPKGYWKMVRVLEANGLTYEVARIKAHSLLTGEYND